MRLSFLSRLFLISGVCALPVAGQVRSPIGDYLQPYGGLTVAMNIAMTPDGEWIFFEESWGSGCSSGAFQRISMIHPDGTGYRVVLDEAVIAASQPTAANSLIKDIRVSGDARWLAFSMPAKISVTCVELPPVYWYLVDVEAGAVQRFKWNGKQIGTVSYSDDGAKMVFQGYDAGTDSWWFHVGEPQGTTLTNVTKFLDTSPWFTANGIISGDGSRFLFAGTHNTFPFPSDAYLYEFESQRITKVSPEPVNDIWGLSLSGDGSRLLYAGAFSGPIFAMNSDGSDFHALPNVATFGSATLSRDGQRVFWADWTNGPASVRSTWDGREQVTIKGWTDTTAVASLPVNRDGSMMALVAQDLGFWDPLGVWFDEGPVLTTYGYGTPGSTITWDIGGEEGDSFVLLWSLVPGSVRLPGYGLLSLEPSRMGILATGPVGGTDNIGKETVTLPPGLLVPAPVEIHFQALVLDADRATGGLTNRTTFTVHDGGIAASATPTGEDCQLSTKPALGSGAPSFTPPAAPTPEERLRQMMLDDPSVWDRMGEPDGQ
jgi:hypothetical protein